MPVTTTRRRPFSAFSCVEEADFAVRGDLTWDRTPWGEKASVADNNEMTAKAEIFIVEM